MASGRRLGSRTRSRTGGALSPTGKSRRGQRAMAVRRAGRVQVDRVQAGDLADGIGGLTAVRGGRHRQPNSQEMKKGVKINVSKIYDILLDGNGVRNNK